MIEKIKFLKNAGKIPDEIEQLLLSGKLGRICLNKDGYQCIGKLLLSWLVTEAYKPGFIEWMWKHPKEYVVHHIDGNKLNNVYLNLRIMSQSDHARLHCVDPKFVEARKVRDEVCSATMRKNNGWIDLSVFQGPFTGQDYAEASGICYSTAYFRLMTLVSEGQLVCEKKVTNMGWHNVYRRKQ